MTPKTYFVTLIAPAGQASFTVEADSVTAALAQAHERVQAEFQAATQWHVSQQESEPE